MDFIDDPPESTDQERFQRHNRFLHSLKSDTLLIIDNFNVTAAQDSFLSVVLKYRCQILFTTRSKLDEYCTLPLKEIEDMNALFQLTSVFYSEADTYRATVEKIIETVHSHTFAVELAAKLLKNGISTPDQLLTRLQVEKAAFHNEDKIKIIKDGQSSKATYYSHIHTLFSLYTLSLKQQDIMCNMCFLPSTGISARIFAKWLELPTLNEINDLIETGFVPEYADYSSRRMALFYHIDLYLSSRFFISLELISTTSLLFTCQKCARKHTRFTDHRPSLRKINLPATFDLVNKYQSCIDSNDDSLNSSHQFP